MKQESCRCCPKVFVASIKHGWFPRLKSRTPDHNREIKLEADFPHRPKARIFAGLGGPAGSRALAKAVCGSLRGHRGQGDSSLRFSLGLDLVDQGINF